MYSLLKIGKMKNFQKVLYKNRIDLSALGIALALALYLFIVPTIMKNPDEAIAALTKPFYFWISYLVLFMAIVAGYANGKHQKKDGPTSSIVSVVIVFTLVFGLDFLYINYDCPNTNLILTAAYVAYSLSKLISFNIPFTSETPE